MALVVVDVPIRVDRLDLAFHGAQLAGAATFLATLEPVEQAELAGHRQGRAERADVAAVDLAGEQVHHQQHHHVEHEPPLAVELQGDGGLERLHLGGLLGQHHGFQGDAEQRQQDDVLDGPQALMHRERQLVLGDLDLARQLVEQFLQGAERAQPAAEHATAPQQDAGGGEHPEDEDDRIGEEQLPAEVLEHRVDEGQHVDHRQLPQGIPADEHHGEDQVAATQPVQELRLLGEFVLQEQDHRQQAQGRAQHADLEALLVPDVDPQRTVGFLDGGQFLGGQRRTLDVALGHQVGHLEAGEDARHRTDLAAHQQFQVPGRARIEAVLLAGDEDRHLVEVRHALGVHVGQADEVQVAEADDVAELAQLHPIEDAAAHVARALEGIFAVGQHREGVLARLELFHQLGVLTLAQQIAANGRYVQVGGVQVDEGFVALLRRGLRDALGLGALEGVIDLTAGQVHAADGAVAGQLGPVARLIGILAHHRDLRPRIGAGLDQVQVDGHGIRGAHDDLVDHHHRHGGAGHGIDGHRALVTGMADHHALIDLDAGVVRVEVVDLLFGDTDQHDRFVVLEHVGVANGRRVVEDDLQVDRLAGVGRHVGHADALEGVAEQLVTLADGAHPVVPFRLGHRRRLREDQVDALALQRAVVLGLNHLRRSQRHQQQEK